MADGNPMDGKLREVARAAGLHLLFGKPSRVIGSGIDIFDVQGPLLFVDYLIESSSGGLGWVRTMPDALGSQAGPLVAAQYGPHPALRALNDPGFQAKNLQGNLRFFSQLSRQRAS